jgi:hypothetical protein
MGSIENFYWGVYCLHWKGLDGFFAGYCILKNMCFFEIRKGLWKTPVFILSGTWTPLYHTISLSYLIFIYFFNKVGSKPLLGIKDLFLDKSLS